MKLGADFPQEWKSKSIKEQITLSDLLYGYVVENLMQRIEASPFKEYLWITNEDAIGEDAYKKKVKERLEFIYVESGKKNFYAYAVAGQPFDSAVVKLLVKELFIKVEEKREDLKEVTWEYQLKETGAGVYLLLTGTYMDMDVPLSLQIDAARLSTKNPKKKEVNLLFESNKTLCYYIYSKENLLAESLFEIMRKLELISDMENYDIVNEIIKTQTIRGRHIMAHLLKMGEKEPKVITMKRLQQITSYRNYAYMKKKWQQYEKKHKEETEDWEEILDSLLRFLSPIWTALCEDEIFLDDWMPELGRFLG